MNRQDRLFLAVVALIYLLGSLSLLLSWPLLWPDEAVFADTAHTVLQSGYPASSLVAGMERSAVWQPPLWFYCAAPVIAIFGYDIIPLRLFSVALGLLIIGATFVYARRLGLSTWTSRVGVLLLALNPNFVTYVKLARMDGLCALFTILGLVFYAQFCVDGKKRALTAAGSLFGLAALTHPLGLIGVVAATVHAGTGHRGKKAAFGDLAWIAVPAAVAIGIWMFSANDFADLLAQLTFQAQRKTRPFYEPIAGFAERYRSLPVFGILIPAGLIHVGMDARRTRAPLSRLAAIVVFVSTGAVALTFELTYHVYCLPFLSLAVAGLLERLSGVGGRWRRRALVGLGAVICNFAAYTLFFNYQFHVRLRAETDYDSFVEEISQAIPDSATICFTGYPCVYWGLIRQGKAYRLKDEAFLTDSLGIAVLSGAEWVVVANGFSPDDDAPNVVSQVTKMETYARMAERTLVAERFIGARLWYAYTARVFKVSRAYHDGSP